MNKKYYVLNEDMDPVEVFGQIITICVDEDTIKDLEEDFDNPAEMFHEASEEEIEKYGTV